MEIVFDKLNLFFDTIKTITWWQRIFGWKNVRSLSYDAYEEFKSLSATLDTITADLETTKNSLSLLENDNSHLKQETIKAEADLIQLMEKYDSQTSTLQE
ncbi:unnamed protein product, partial [marine sediment metagenome]